MDREIRFRAWVKDEYWNHRFNHPHDQMFPVYGLEPSEVLARSDYGWSRAEVELMQFTGLLDKSGKEIYEGDVVKDTYFDTELRVVKFEDAWFFAESPDTTKQDRRYPIGAEKVEVIGNIWESPELLKEANA